MWSLSIPAVTLVMALAAVATALRAVQTARTPQGAVGWVVFIFALPVLGIPAFLLVGNMSRKRFAARRQAADAQVAARRREAVAAGLEPGRLGVFEALAGTAAESGSGARLLVDGDVTFEALYDAIGSARSYLLVQFFLIRGDAEGDRLAEALIARAQAGVRVCLSYGAFRGTSPPRRLVRRLREGGVEVHQLRGPRRPLGRLHINYRNHRKMVIADGRVSSPAGTTSDASTWASIPPTGAGATPRCR